MANLNTPAIAPGRINAADLDAARKHSTGTVRLVPAGCGQYRWPERRVNWHDTVPTDYSTPGWLDSCAPEGGVHRDTEDAMESMFRYRRTCKTVALALLLAVVGVVARICWPMAGA